MDAVGLLLAAAVASAPAPAPAPARNAPAEWLVKPTADEIWWAYPPAAVRAAVAGKARIRCRVQTNGLASGCEVLSEDPPGWGFGEAALGLTSTFRFSPHIQAGKPVEGGMTTTISFTLGEGPSGLPPPAEQLALALRLVEAMDAREGLKNGVINILAQAFEAERDDPLSVEERKAAVDALDDVWAQYADRVLQNVADALARRLTRAEIEAAIAFQEGPVGRKLRAQAPLAIAEAAVMSQDLVEQQKQAVRRRFCERQPQSRRCYNPDAT